MPGLSELGDAHGDRDRVNSEIAVIKRVCIYTWRLRWSELRDALGSRN